MLTLSSISSLSVSRFPHYFFLSYHSHHCQLFRYPNSYFFDCMAKNFLCITMNFSIKTPQKKWPNSFFVSWIQVKMRDFFECHFGICWKKHQGSSLIRAWGLLQKENRTLNVFKCVWFILFTYPIWMNFFPIKLKLLKNVSYFIRWSTTPADSSKSLFQNCTVG